MVSLRTRRFREAEHRAALLDREFSAALARARQAMGDNTDLNATLRANLRDVLGRDALASDPASLPAQGRAAPAPAPAEAAPSASTGGPLASTMVEPHFQRRATIDRTRHQVIGQERNTLRLFFEVCGDRPPADYQRGDVTQFLGTLRRMPALYNRSRTAPPKSVADIIAEADASQADRLTDKTVKRHLTALSQFFRFALDEGKISVAAHGELVKGHRFKASKNARDQRDAWAPEELTALFKTPVWSGRDAARATQPGPHIIRDAKFWLPILALFHGGRLEEFADLYGRDLQCDAGTWFLNIVETEADESTGRKGRSLKTGNATRALPLHPEVIRLGFVQYAQENAPNPDDPLFPDLPPQGKDGRRGARFTRDFIYYRQQVGVYRQGVGMHAFRHTAITRLTDAITDFQQKRHRDYLMGHGGSGTEGDVRYDKGPGLKAVAATLALLRYPEIDLSHLHVHPAPEVDAGAVITPRQYDDPTEGDRQPRPPTESHEEQLARIAREFYEYELRLDAEERLAAKGPSTRAFLQAAGFVEVNEGIARRGLGFGNEDGRVLVADFADKVCAREGIPRKGQGRLALDQALLRALVEVQKRARERDGADFSGKPSDPLLLPEKDKRR
ncbi:hypothetical protein GXW78_24005 [Roseomonas terrae]|uniref:Integrase n=1 Tax=Neoroseomonas terrae TaxID=424799 RepID=A0ABS5ENY1_9PROT|nr:hypothetical protein [Neoroseomonas terrae]MBR0652742.1 hypothetical protein [Neoroseomonas terrae]